MPATTVELAQTGEYLGHHQMPYTLGQEHLEQMARNAEGAPVVIDYEHANQLAEYGTEVPAAGWINRVWVEDDSLYGEVEWTDRAATMIDNDEYRYLSPVIDLDGVHPNTGEPIGAVLKTVGLTNVPFIKGMEPVTNSRSTADGEHALRTLSPTSRQALRNHQSQESASSKPTPDAMSEENRSTLAAMKRKLKGIFNSATDDELDLLDEARQAKQRADALKSAKDDLEKKLNEAQEQIDTLSEQLSEAETAQQEQQEAQDESLLNSAVEKGKIKKADRDDWASRLDGNREATRALLNSIEPGTVLPGGGSGPDKPDSKDTDDTSAPTDPYAEHVQQYAG